MKLSEARLAELVKRLGERAVIGWHGKTPAQRASVAADLSEQIIPILQKLAPDQDPADLPAMRDFFRTAALEFIVVRMRRSMIFRDASDFTILENVAESELDRVALHLLGLTMLALELMPEEESLETLLTDFETWDADGELQQLLEDEGPTP